MTENQLKNKIKTLVRKIYKEDIKSKEEPSGYDKLVKFPELKRVLVDLLTNDFGFFLKSVDWVAPRPSTFFIRLKNEHGFYLIYSKRSWIAEIEGKKYYLSNTSEEETASEAISRLLRYEASEEAKVDSESEESDWGGDSSPEPEETPEEEIEF